MDSGLGGFSFETNHSHNKPPANTGDFGLMGLDFGGASNQPQPSTTPKNTGFDDLMGFGGSSTASQPSPQHHQPAPPSNSGFGADLMGFGFDAPSQPPPQTQPPPQNTGFSGGFSFDSSPSQPPTYQQPKPPASQPQNDFGFDVLGGGSAPQPSKPAPQAPTSGFQPITNTNPNKIMAYENQHVQIWMDCIK